jgi:2-(1,2-epoxy-1,2-dihydrophenyl)acetyl-CoA isomerase
VGVIDDDRVLLRELDGGVLRLVLNRPAAGNSFDTALQRQLVDAFTGASGDPEVRVVVLTATGDRHFCTGPDLRDPQLAPDPERVAGDAARRLREGTHRMVTAMLDCEKPIVCGLNGTAAGAGANLVFAADLVVAVEHATIIELFTRRGLIPDGGAAYLLSRRLPPNVAKQLVFFAEALDMTDAQRLGLVNAVVPIDQLEATVAGWASRLAAGPTRAFAAAKQLLNVAADDGREASFALEALLVEQIAATDDVAEGVAAFLEKREPRFQGR